MASYIYTANSTSQLSVQLATDKIRISTITPIAISIGDANTIANISTSEIIPGNTVMNSVIVGQGNYLAFINVGTATAQPFSITELGAAYPE